MKTQIQIVFKCHDKRSVQWKPCLIFALIFFLQYNGKAVPSSAQLKNIGPYDTLKCRILLQNAETASPGEWEKYNSLLKTMALNNLNANPSGPNAKLFRRYYCLAMNNEGVSYQNHSGHGTKALMQFIEALKIANKINDTFCIATSLHNLAGYYLGIGDDEKAISYYSLALQLRMMINDKHGIVQTYNSLGYIYQDKGDLIKTLNYYYTGLKICEETKNTVGHALTLNNIGSVHNLLNDTYKALDCFHKSLEIYQSLPNVNGAQFPLHNLGHIYLRYGNVSRAMDYYHQSLNVAEKTNDRKGIACSQEYLAEIYFHRKEFPQAISMYSLALVSSKAISDKRGIATACYGLARSFHAIKRMDEATKFAEKFLKISEHGNYTEYIWRGASLLAKIYKSKGNFEKAFYLQDLADRLEDKLRSQELSKENIKKQIEYEYQAKEREFNLKQAMEGKIQKALYDQKRGYTISAYVLFVGLISLFLGFVYYRNRLKRQRAEQLLLLQIKDSEIRALQAQMNPHFIFNSLNSVLEFVRKSEQEEALKYLSKFSRLIRMTLESSEKRTIRLSSELELLALYIDLENLRFGNNFVYTQLIDDGIDVENVEIPTLVIQPVVENAILHGLQNKYILCQQKNEAYEPKLLISVQRQENFLRCVVQDNGAGREKAAEIISKKLFSHRSMGMRITTQRLNLLGQNKCRLETCDLKDAITGESLGTRVEILIPINSEKKLTIQ